MSDIDWAERHRVWGLWFHEVEIACQARLDCCNLCGALLDGMGSETHQEWHRRHGEDPVA